MTRMKQKQPGRPKKSKSTSVSDRFAMMLLSEYAGWWDREIAMLWGLKAGRTIRRNIVRYHKEDEKNGRLYIPKG